MDMTSLDQPGFLRLRQVLAIVPVSRSSWWSWVRDGRAPKPVRLGPATVAWRRSEIAELVERLGADDSAPTENRGARLAAIRKERQAHRAA